MKIFAVVSVACLVLSACGDDTVVPDAGDAAEKSDSTISDATLDTTQDTTPPIDAPGDTTASDAPSDAPDDTGLDAPSDALAAHCTNKSQDVDETDIDCGGTACPKCMSGQKCLVPTDCVSNNCKGNKTCQ